ncbi:alpha-1,3-mannosyltransferase ALG2 [Trametes versicolor FP-101664 SS1]|uniref:alpha-1,3-mannosyltransferase ALG2 n=1 Tax=Trametes versicolor (strain FP-101664) TaxID=717944 RepID=UPI0004623E00|nr:alpha-1,3-mannosyltransferase ALG2 [Trametes versicolor FP-101664 SS1]EIW60942.1 alpha-1,3-mannosyltransferase ALG2 [Trametes versicolor FP-101664 SS1]
MSSRRLRIAFIHPDLGIGGAERLVVDAALGLQKLGHSVDIFTSHHDRGHCFEETRDGTLRVHLVSSPFPRAIKGKLHVLFSHARQLHLTRYLLSSSMPSFDVYFVDLLPTCIPFLRLGAHTRVLYYCHFPDKLMSGGAYVEGARPKGSLLKRIYRLPMDAVEEIATRQADTILVNSNFTKGVFKRHFPSVQATPRVVYPGINLDTYKPVDVNLGDADITSILSDRPTLLSVNRFESKKNAALAIDSFALLRRKLSRDNAPSRKTRLVLAGGYDPRLMDNVKTLQSLLDGAKAHGLTYAITTPSNSTVALPSLPSTSEAEVADIVFLLNFSTAQRSALLTSPSTLALLYTPTNEHFGIGPVEGMVCGLPVLACNSGGPTESVVDEPASERTGWLRPPKPEVWAEALVEIVDLPAAGRAQLAERAKRRAREKFGMEAMARDMEQALQETFAMGRVPTPLAIWFALALLFVVAAYAVRLVL